jgi:hypothetical protein
LPDDISLSDAATIPTLAGAGHSQLTDLYLLALAVRHSAVFATFDRRIDPAMVVGGMAALLVIS